jgi:hypothetical protein
MGMNQEFKSSEVLTGNIANVTSEISKYLKEINK